MSNGTAYGDHFSAYAYKRIELHEDNLFYIKDALSPVSEDCTDAAEFTPALIVDGKKIMDDYWTGEQPRACIGQSENYEILMLVIEGRYPLEGILGTSVNNCSEILLQHKCMQAINLDGGSSAMLWFDGEYVTQSSSSLCATLAAVPCRTHGSIKKPNKRPAAPAPPGAVYCKALNCPARECVERLQNLPNLV
ncbi:MAG: phosphodiester glycosidase family protein [Acutalibacteraceae bacterium]